MKATYDCTPTLNDNDVIEFCKNGFLTLEGVVDHDTNQKTIEYVERNTGEEPIEILEENWFVDNVIKNTAAAGAIRSLLGKNFGLPIDMANHRVKTPQPAQEWHTDAGALYSYELNYLQVFYLPQECTREMGPTEMLPGSHFLFAHRDAMKNIGRIRGSYYAVAPAGSIVITHYGIWHRRSESIVKTLRNNLKWNYWRTVSPTRDWVINPNFDLTKVDFNCRPPTYRQMAKDAYDTAEMYLWLRGEHEKFKLIGGQGWPLSLNKNTIPYGFPSNIKTS